MVQDVVIGTLSTLSTIVSPLGPSLPTETQLYRYELEPNSALLSHCQIKSKTGSNSKAGALEESKLGLHVESLGESYFTVHFKGSLCTSTAGLKSLSEDVRLPNEILDDAFIERLPLNRAYVTSAIPSARAPGAKSRVKLTRLEPENGLQPVRIEWIPEQGFETEHRPLTIWIAKAQGSLAKVPGFTPQSLRWRKLQFAYKHPLLSRPLSMKGSLSRIDLDTRVRQESK